MVYKHNFSLLTKQRSLKGMTAVTLSEYTKITDNKNSEDNSIPAECLEIVLFDVIHKELDNEN